VASAAADAAAADRAVEEAEVERVRKEQVERELEEQRKKDAAAAAEAAAQRAAEERQKAEEDAKVQRELEAERAAAAVEAQRKADLLKKLAALDEGKSVTPAAPPAPTFEAMPVPELATTTQPTKLAQTPAAVEAPQEEVAPPAHAAPAIEAADPVPGWLVQQAKASPKTDRKVLDLQSSFDDSASIGSTSSRRSRRELPQASRESDNLHRGFPASGPLAVVADSESRVSSGRSQHSMTSMTSKLGADNKFVMPGISSSATAAAPSPRTSEKSKLQEGGALPGIGTTAAGSVAKPLTRSRGRLGGPSRGGSKGGGGFHGPKRKKAAMPWDKAKQDSGNSGAGPTAAITSDGLEELETIAI
jgi:dTMP kinase